MAEIHQHRGCKIVIVRDVTSTGMEIMRYEITPDSDNAKEVFRRQGVDMITGSKMLDPALEASRKEIDLLFDECS